MRLVELTRLEMRVPTWMQVAQRRRWTLSRNSRPPVKAVSDVEIRVLLERYRCPVPSHAVRTRFLGGIASPVMSASPLDAVKALWGGEFPEFDSPRRSQ